MARYLDLARLKTRVSEGRIVQLTDDDGAGVVNTDVLEQIFSDVDSTIDGFCRGRYPLPLNPVPEIIQTWAKDLGAYYLFNRRPGEVEIPDGVENNYKTAIDLLKRVQDGRMPLYDTETPAAVASAAGVEFAPGVGTPFNNRSLRGF